MSEQFNVSMMYEQQIPAFEARAELMGVKTDSTPDVPPSHPQIDWNEVCKLKKSIVFNLPKTCCHCGAEYPPNSFVEHRGDVMAYCKKKGACGRSLLLYSGIEPSVPVYEKICRFHKPVNSEPEPEHTVYDLAGIRHVQYAMHGIVKPDVICTACSLRYDEHEDAERIARADQNGWVEKEERQPVVLPDDWPEYDPETFTWICRCDWSR